ncbi:leucine-rich repeat domain-containing protein [Mucilaginibacter ximonensis]|uniref:Leucine-rich repeat domain-containing protein n=1 Tax=Mucilaginibacter ximonensis TaxID=538021 RepID=A0ABW5YGU8_9SPHI
MKNLHVISFSKYKAELPPSITRLAHIDSIKLSTTNIGNNNLSGVQWKKAHITGDPAAWKDSTGIHKQTEEKALLSLVSVKTLRTVYFDDIKLNDPSIIKRFTQIEDLRGLFEGDDDPEAFLIALSSLNNVHTLYLNLFYDRSISLNWIANMPQLQDVFIGGMDHPFKSFEALGQLTNLKSLTLHQFALGAMPDIFGKLNHLKNLQLTLNGITKVPAGLFNLPALENLDLTENSLTYLPPLLSYGCTGLKHVNLMMNQLTSLPAAFSGLQNLETLNCSNNKIETIPGGWAYLTHLKEVNFAINHLTEFPEGLQNNHSVERITLFFNKIQTVPDIDGDGYKLRYLGITGNRNMFALPEHIGAYTQLDTLEAQYLNLNELPESLGDCKQLKMLLLSRSITKKTTLPSGLKDTRNLEILELNDNPLLDHRSIFDVILSQPRSNFRINLSNCDIRQLPSASKWLSIPFVSMNLRDNPISELPQELINSKVKGAIDTNSTNIHP